MMTLQQQQGFFGRFRYCLLEYGAHNWVLVVSNLGTIC